MLMKCDWCGKEHDIEILEDTVKAIVKGQEVEFKEQYCHCNIENEDYIPGDMVKSNLERARKAYEEQLKAVSKG